MEDLTPNVLNWLMSVIIQFEPRHQCCHQLLLLTLHGNISAGSVIEVNEQWKDPTRLTSNNRRNVSDIERNHDKDRRQLPFHLVKWRGGNRANFEMMKIHCSKNLNRERLNLQYEFLIQDLFKKAYKRSTNPPTVPTYSRSRQTLNLSRKVPVGTYNYEYPSRF